MSPRTDVQRATLPATFDAQLVQLAGELLEAHRKARKAFALAEETMDLGDEEAAQEHDAAAMEHAREAEAIARRMTALPAETLEGMRAKARAVEWFYPDAVIDLGIRGRATDVELAESILADLLRNETAGGALGGNL
jgi:hypothetical protein